MCQLVFFQRFCDVFLLLFLLFIGNMIKQLISEVTVCLFSFSSLQAVQIKKKKEKNNLCSQYYSWSEILQKGVFSDRKQFNLAIGEGCCSLEALVQSPQSKVRGCFCSVSSNKSCITRRANQAFFAKCCIVPQKRASSDWQ